MILFDLDNLDRHVLVDPAMLGNHVDNDIAQDRFAVRIAPGHGSTKASAEHLAILIESIHRHDELITDRLLERKPAHDRQTSELLVEEQRGTKKQDYPQTQLAETLNEFIELVSIRRDRIVLASKQQTRCEHDQPGDSKDTKSR